MKPDWKSDGLEFYRGDCLCVLPGLPSNSIDLIATDPPYYKVKGEAWDRQWDKPAAYLEWLDRVLAEFQRVLKPNGSLYLFASPKMAARVECLVGERFGVLNRIVWAKPQFSTKAEMFRKGDLRSFFPVTEYLFFAEHHHADSRAKGESGYGAECDKLRGFVFEPLRAYLDGERRRAGVDFEQVRQAVGCRPKSGLPGHWFTRSQWMLPTATNYAALQRLFNSSCNGQGPQYLCREYEDLRREYDYLRREYEDLRRPFHVSADVPYTDVWTFPTVGHYKGKHPCEKPLAMMEHIVRASSRGGATVLDAFAGSFVMAEACRNLGRQFIGIEQSEGYFNRAKCRFTIDAAALFT